MARWTCPDCSWHPVTTGPLAKRTSPCALCCGHTLVPSVKRLAHARELGRRPGRRGRAA